MDELLTDDVIACVREALTNVAKHARATSASVDVVTGKGELTLTVSDNGVGTAGASRSSGTENLQARAARRGGSATIGPGSAGGTTVHWRVPTQ